LFIVLSIPFFVDIIFIRLVALDSTFLGLQNRHIVCQILSILLFISFLEVEAFAEIL